MVVDTRADEEVDRLFHALADTTRRDIVQRCVGGESSVSRLAEVYPMSFAAVQKHIAVLERAGLVDEGAPRARAARAHGALPSSGHAGPSTSSRRRERGHVERMAALIAEGPG